MIINNNLFKKKLVLLFLVAVGVVTMPTRILAEGTKTISPTSTYCTSLGLLSARGTGAYEGCPQDNRIYFRIKDHLTEKFYYGFRWMTYANSGTPSVVDNMYMKIYNPNGTLAATVALPASGAGLISTYASAATGPVIGTLNSGGYTPLVFTPTVDGEYWVEFLQNTSTGTTSAQTQFLCPYFDLTVASTSAIYNGRVHCDKWGFVATDPAAFTAKIVASADPILYPYTDDGVVYKLDFESGFMPIAFDVAINSYGSQNTGDWLTDRKSKNSLTTPSLSNGYKIFLNEPDPTLYPYAVLPPVPVFASPAILGCYPGPYKLRFNISEAGDCVVLLDLDGTSGYQSGGVDRRIELVGRPAGLNVYDWDGKDGLGNSVAAGSSLAVSLVYRKGRANLPIYDAEINKNGFVISSIAPTAETLKIYWDDSGVSVLSGNSVEGNNNTTGPGISNDINGQLCPAHAWSGNGNPTMAIPAPAVGINETDDLPSTDFGNVRVINSWFYGINITAYSSTQVNCVNISGKIWDDANNSANGTFTNINSTGETGANTTLYANLIDPVTNTIIATATVASDGTYTLTDCPVNGNDMPVIITTSAGVKGATAPSAAIPAGWVNTSPLTRKVTTITASLTNIDFGIQQKPTANSDTKQIYEDNTATGNVLTNDTDPENTTLTVTSFTINGIGYNPGDEVTLSGIGTFVLNQNGSYTFTPVADYNGTVPTVNYTIVDAGNVASSSTLVITVLPVNDQPTFTKGGDQTKPVNAGAQTVTGWATALSNGPADEASQTHSFTVTNDNNALFSVQPTISSNGILTYTPAQDASGVATVTVVLKDNGGTANGGVDTSITQTFTITITPAANVSVFKTIDVQNPLPGSTVIFTITVVNNGPSTATNVVVTDNLPAGYTYVSTSPTAGVVYSAVTKTLSWTLSSLAKNATSSIQVSATVNP